MRSSQGERGETSLQVALPLWDCIRPGLRISGREGGVSRGDGWVGGGGIVGGRKMGMGMGMGTYRKTKLGL